MEKNVAAFITISEHFSENKEILKLSHKLIFDKKLFSEFSRPFSIRQLLLLLLLHPQFINLQLIENSKSR
jgi:hypothetical protein